MLFFSLYLLVTPTFIIEPIFFRYALFLLFFFAISVGTPTFIIEPEKSNPVGLPRSLEVTAGFEPADNGVADRGLTTWLRHHDLFCLTIIAEAFGFVKPFFTFSL